MVELSSPSPGAAAPPWGTSPPPSERLLRGVIFDLDGVLFDSIGVMEEAFLYACQASGREAPPFSEYCKHLGRGFFSIMDVMGLPHDLYEPFVQKSEELQDKVSLFAGVGAVLRELRAQRFYIGAATGKSHERASALLRQLGIDAYFELVVGFDDVAFGKPHPEAILRHVQQSGLRPYELLVVGDAPSDMLAGRSAGIFTAAALWGCRTVPELLKCLPDLVVSELGDFTGLLHDWQARAVN
jgi:AHBA synthesis associated protein